MLAIRGAIQVEADSPEAISAAVAMLCRQIVLANRLKPSKIVSAIFTLTPDLLSAFPARAARERGGWQAVPMICAREIPVPDAPPRICRVLVHVQGHAKARHVYLGAALDLLRPDLAGRRPRRKQARSRKK